MLDCILYFAITGILSFLFGRCIRPENMNWDRFPYCLYSFEKNGSIYRKIGIQHWQNKVPDMSKVFPMLMPPKKMVDISTKALRRMIQETCTAELTHILLCFTGFYCTVLWPGIGGIILSVLNVVLFILPFILIQRYNRPRLLRLYKKQTEKEMLAASCQP